jgi:methylase of polypeptide subunit release factors
MFDTAGTISSSESARGASRPLEYENRQNAYNHNVFRFPAKFHPPVARALVQSFSRPGHRLLDPFCGSGTLLVEALLAERSVVGTDVDPLAIFVSRAKTLPYCVESLKQTAEQLAAIFERRRMSDLSRFGPFTQDIERKEVNRAFPNKARPFVPPIPNLTHWFRCRVTMQLATIASDMAERVSSPGDRCFFYLCCASIIRNASNADPVPVSGLEVTKHMLRREAVGRVVDPYELIIAAIRRNLLATESFVIARRGKAGLGRVAVADARELSVIGTGPVDAVITSPPYLNAVDYYRRHQLEMFWLGLVGSQEERLHLVPKYIGRADVRAEHLRALGGWRPSKLAETWLAKLSTRPPARLRSFKQYCLSLARSLTRFSSIVKPGGKVVIVVGENQIYGEAFPTGQLIEELAPPTLSLEDVFWYSLENRYMSYTRRNGADIKTEQVLVFRSV